MNLISVAASRPVLVFMLLAFVVVLLPSSMIPCWYRTVKEIERDVKLSGEKLGSGLKVELDNTSKLLHPMNSSATNLARVLTSSLNTIDLLSFTDINDKIAPVLYLAFSTVSHVVQVSYIGSDGFFFSYYTNVNNETLAMYCNASFPSNSSSELEKKDYTWYTQPVDLNTGNLYGEATKQLPLDIVNTDWFEKALSSGSQGYVSLGTAWKESKDPLVLSTGSLNGAAVVSLGFSAKALTDFLMRGVNIYGGHLYLSTTDGEVLDRGLPNARMAFNNNSIDFSLLDPNGSDLVSHVGNFSCLASNGGYKPHILKIGDSKYQLYCSSIDLIGLPVVYALLVPQKGLVSIVNKNSKLAFLLLALMIGAVIISVFTFVYLTVRAAKRDVFLCANLIKQREATEQAERKSMNKSLAFASASHDIRTSLACISGLIEMCSAEVSSHSEIAANLQRMNNCTKDLVGLLNSILDISKIEDGKMQLEEEEFNLAQLIEEIVDLFYPAGMKKGVDIVLDPSDGSVMKFSNVRGDKGRLQQILVNLISNAIKFTSEGQVKLRAWVRKPSLRNTIVESNKQNRFLKYLSCLIYKNKDARNDLEAVNAIRTNPDSMEFFFEVDDTGKGIPKEKRKSIFENYVQVKETALGQGGIGLGLGIVQSLVRLMGGEIAIVDKEMGEPGTCFRFSVFLLTSQTPASNINKEDFEEKEDSPSSFPQNLSVQTGNTPTPTRIQSPRLNILSSSPKLEGSKVVLLIHNDERRRITQKYMEDLGINVSVVDRSEHLRDVLKKIKSKHTSSHNSMAKMDSSSISDMPSPSSKDVPLSALDGNDHNKPSFYKKRGGLGFILLVIDASAGPVKELYKIVSEFRNGLSDACCRVVWLNKPSSKSTLSEDDDVSFSMPLHGSRLHQVVKLLPEFGGKLPEEMYNPKDDDETFEGMSKLKKDDEPYEKLAHTPEISYSAPKEIEQVEIQEVGASNEKGKKEIIEKKPVPNKDKPLTGKRILVAEDNAVMQMLTRTRLQQMGAIVEVCGNGEEAVQKVSNGLKDHGEHQTSSFLPYDYIFMDCEMPVMDGFEAARKIREEEKGYGVHIPIIALTAHTSDEAGQKPREAGMDLHLCKPPVKESLVEAIKNLDSK